MKKNEVLEYGLKCLSFFLVHYFEFCHHWICCAERMDIYHAPTPERTTAAGLFQGQSLALRAEGMSNQNCKLTVCPHRWLQRGSHLRLDTSLSSAIAAIFTHLATIALLWRPLRYVKNLIKFSIDFFHSNTGNISYSLFT